MTIHVNRAVSEVFSAAESGDPSAEDQDRRWMNAEALRERIERDRRDLCRVQAHDFED